MLPASVAGSIQRYLRQIDRLLPGSVTGLYVVGSVALGGYRERRSDIDFVAVVEGDLTPRELRRLRVQHARSALWTGGTAIRERRSPLTGTCNGVFVRSSDLGTPVTRIAPIAAHVGHSFTTGPVGSDVSPVAWKVLAEQGVAVRGPEPSALPLDPEANLLPAWNLERYWRPWATAFARPRADRLRSAPRRSTAWGVLGAPRLHCTIATGNVVTKEAAGEYALDVFDARFHPPIEDALAYWR